MCCIIPILAALVAFTPPAIYCFLSQNCGDLVDDLAVGKYIVTADSCWSLWKRVALVLAPPLLVLLLRCCCSVRRPPPRRQPKTL
ncbi:unnamed protein product [Linum tenue]|uniref:Uncharacterized protein n=1 Tax=Linum tenue TaxID=586396 RepID=A0AAV0GR42_9ROSI|nr:unnamed protein product [Linum tenue]